MNMEDNTPPDLRSTFYTHLRAISFDEPQMVYEECMAALNGYMDMDTLFGAALPLFHRLGKPLPRMPIIAETLKSTSISEDEAAYLIHNARGENFNRLKFSPRALCDVGL